MILQAGGVLEGTERLHRGGGVRVRGADIVGVLSTPAAVRRAAARWGERVVDLGDGVLLPGLVDAHAHLELGDMAGALPGDEGFQAWLRAILAARRRAGTRRFARSVERGARQLIASGTTAVGDIASVDASAMASRAPLRSVVYREVLDAWNPQRTELALTSVRRALPPRRLRREGVSPHAPYTTSRALLAGVSRLARRRRLPVTVHWAETPGESDWLRSGRGELAPLLPASPRASGLDLLDAAGLLRVGTSLVHGNHPGRGEPARLARAGVGVVHCPGTHAFFARSSFPWRRYARAGVPVALGTDSLASNERLDMRREMALVRASAPHLSPAEVFDMATIHGAHALGMGSDIGRLRRGYRADVVHVRVPARSASAVLEAVTHAEGAVGGVWIGGRRIRS